MDEGNDLGFENKKSQQCFLIFYLCILVPSIDECCGAWRCDYKLWRALLCFALHCIAVGLPLCILSFIVRLIYIFIFSLCIRAIFFSSMFTIVGLLHWNPMCICASKALHIQYSDMYFAFVEMSVFLSFFSRYLFSRWILLILLILLGVWMQALVRLLSSKAMSERKEKIYAKVCSHMRANVLANIEHATMVN